MASLCHYGPLSGLTASTRLNAPEKQAVLQICSLDFNGSLSVAVAVKENHDFNNFFFGAQANSSTGYGSQQLSQQLYVEVKASVTCSVTDISSPQKKKLYLIKKFTQEVSVETVKDGFTETFNKLCSFFLPSHINGLTPVYLS